MAISIFNNQHYNACILKNGALVISSNKKQKGKMILQPQAQEWIDAITQDQDCASAICKVIYKS